MTILNYDKLSSIIMLFIFIFNIYTIFYDKNKVLYKYSDKDIEKDLNILIKCYKNIDYINHMNYKKEDKNIKYYYKYFNIGNFALTYDELQHPIHKIKKNYKNKNNYLTKYMPCLYIMKSMELSYSNYDIFNYY